MRGYMRRATSMPGQYDRKAASAVSSNSPKIRILFLEAQAELDPGNLASTPTQRERSTPRGRWRDRHGGTRRSRHKDGGKDRSREMVTLKGKGRQ